RFFGYSQATQKKLIEFARLLVSLVEINPYAIPFSHFEKNGFDREETLSLIHLLNKIIEEPSDTVGYGRVFIRAENNNSFVSDSTGLQTRNYEENLYLR